MRVLIVLLCLFLIPCALSAQDSSLCEGQQYDVDGDNVVGVGDVLSVLSWFGTVLDADQDGTLDCNDDCVGVYDECGVCNGPGPQVQVLDTIIITYDSIYVEAINDWVTYELGADSVFTRRISADWTSSFRLRVACIHTRFLAFGVSHFSLHRVYR